MYLIDPADDSVSVFEATRHDRWLAHSRHRLNPAVHRVLGCGGYTGNGHRWIDGYIQLPGLAIAAQTCPAYHPGELVMARLSHTHAAAASAHVASPGMSPTAYLRARGDQVDLNWPTTSGHEPVRLHRDDEGQFVLAMPCWPWPFVARR